MTRAELEHIIRAAGTIADVEDLVVIGSQAVLGQFPNAPAELLVSNEADIFPSRYPERSDLIDSTIGEGSPFQRSFGYYAHGVGEKTALLAPRSDGSGVGNPGIRSRQNTSRFRGALSGASHRAAGNNPYTFTALSWFGI
jgi:hypothetical protein